MQNTDQVYSEIKSYVAARRFDRAEATCLQAIASGWDRPFWLRTLAFVCFLNEEDEDARYNRAFSYLHEWGRIAPGDPDAHFWTAYLHLILLDDRMHAENELRKSIGIDPKHAYAALVLGEILESGDSIALLEQCLKQQPGNMRALRALATRLENLGDVNEARAVQSKMLNQRAFVETRCGVMNEYINDVLTGATHAARWQEELRHTQEYGLNRPI